jgi:hypothetical protein
MTGCADKRHLVFESEMLVAPIVAFIFSAADGRKQSKIVCRETMAANTIVLLRVSLF